MHAQIVRRLFADGTVEDMLKGVVAYKRCFVDESCGTQIHFIRAEHHAIDEVHRRIAQCEQTPEVRSRVAISGVLQADELFYWNGFSAHSQGVAKRPIGVWKTKEQLAMLVMRRTQIDVAVAGEDIHFQDAVMDQSITK